MRAFLGACLVAAVAATSAGGQSVVSDEAVIQSPIMVVDFERVFTETLYGQRITQELNAERERVQAENDRLAEELLAEEAALTQARATMPPVDFRAAAEAFNEKAQTVRASREAEQARLVNMLDVERAQFIERIQPLIAELMDDRGAVVAMDRRSVIRAVGSANATVAAIDRIDTTLGDGRQTPDEAPTLRPVVDDDLLIVPDTDTDLSVTE